MKRAIAWSLFSSFLDLSIACGALAFMVMFFYADVRNSPRADHYALLTILFTTAAIAKSVQGGRTVGEKK